MNRRFQFSLRSLLLLAITAGALIGLFVEHRKNLGLQTEIESREKQIDSLSDQLGLFRFSNDPSPDKAWARAAPMRAYEPAGAMRFRLWIPRPGNYRIGVQTKDVVPSLANPQKSEIQLINLPAKGEIAIEALLISETSGSGMYDIHVQQGGGHTQFGNIFGWNDKGFSPHHYNIDTTLQKTTEVDLSKPLILVTVKVHELKFLTGSGATTSLTKNPGPGFMLWIDEEKRP